MAGISCPFCNHLIAISPDVQKTFELSYDASNIPKHKKVADDTIQVSFTKCPNCGKISIHINGLGASVKDLELPVYPLSAARQLPDYIPQEIRTKYVEAYATMPYSLRASAAMARNCLHLMLGDFFQIQRDTLGAELDALKDHVPEQDWKLIASLRKSGKIDAHMKQDTRIIGDADKDEAQKLLKLIEYLFDAWYVKRHEQETLLSEIIGLEDEDKPKPRKRKKS